MADDETLGEVSRNVARLERRVESGQRDTDNRLANLAKDMVPHGLWAAEHKALDEKVSRHEREARDIQTRLEREIADVRKAQAEHAKAHRQAESDAAAWSRKKTLTVVGIIVAALATVAGAWIAAVMAAGGVH